MMKKKSAVSGGLGSQGTVPKKYSGALSPAKAVQSAKTARKNVSASTVAIDYPVERELVTSSHYTIRVSASVPVEISFNGNDWRGCREAAGYWWFDWSGYPSGPYQIWARVCAGPDCWEKTKPRQFTVVN